MPPKRKNVTDKPAPASADARPASRRQPSRKASATKTTTLPETQADVVPAQGPSRRSRRLNDRQSPEHKVPEPPHPRPKPKARQVGKKQTKLAPDPAGPPSAEPETTARKSDCEAHGKPPGDTTAAGTNTNGAEGTLPAPSPPARRASPPQAMLPKPTSPTPASAVPPNDMAHASPPPPPNPLLIPGGSSHSALVCEGTANVPILPTARASVSSAPPENPPPTAPGISHLPASPIPQSSHKDVQDATASTARGVQWRRAAPTTSLHEDVEEHSAREESGTSGSDYSKDEYTYKSQRRQRYNNGTWASSDEIDAEEDLELAEDVVASDEGAPGKKKTKARGSCKGKGKKGKKKAQDHGEDEADEADISDGGDESEDEGARSNSKKGRLPKKVVAEATTLWEKFLEEIDEIAMRTGHARHTLLLASGVALKKHRKLNAWNTFHAVHSINNPRPPGMDRKTWLTEHVKPAYDALFEDCDDSSAGRKKHAKIKQELIKKKEELEMQINKKYDSSGKKYRVVQKIAAEMEEQAQYAHQVCGVEVFGLVYEGGYGDVNATAANTMFASSSEMAAVLADKKVAGRQLIGEIQALVGVKIKQDTVKRKIRDHDGLGNRDEWRHEVQQRFQSEMFPDAEGKKRVHWTKMGWWLYINEKRMLCWPSILPIPNSQFDLNKLNIEALKLLCKAKIKIEDWTQDEKDAPKSKQADIVLISSGSGLTLLTLGQVDEWRAKNAKINKRAVAKKKSLMPSVAIASDEDMNGRLDTNDRFASLVSAAAPRAPSATPPPLAQSLSPEPCTRRSPSRRRSLSPLLTPPPRFNKGKRKALPEDDAGGVAPGPSKCARIENVSQPDTNRDKSPTVEKQVEQEVTGPSIIEAQLDGKMRRFMHIGGKMVEIAE